MAQLVLWSGGLDSTACLWWALTKTRDPVFVHHVRLINRENRHDAEWNAITRMREWLRTNARDFKFSHLSIDFLEASYFPWDMFVACAATGMMCREYPITNVLLGNCLEEGRFPERARAHNAIISAGAWPREMPRRVNPIGHYRKVDLWRSLPPLLAEMTWGCRTPIWRDGHAYECGGCVTCERLQSMREELTKCS